MRSSTSCWAGARRLAPTPPCCKKLTCSPIAMPLWLVQGGRAERGVRERPRGRADATGCVHTRLPCAACGSNALEANCWCALCALCAPAVVLPDSGVEETDSNRLTATFTLAVEQVRQPATMHRDCRALSSEMMMSWHWVGDGAGEQAAAGHKQDNHRVLRYLRRNPCEL